jgi:DNA-binding FrmR family transcriptional regulator
MGLAGSDVAVETADIGLMSDEIERIPQVIAISHQALHAIRQNVIFRAALNGVGRLLLEDHMQGCLVAAAKDGDFEAVFPRSQEIARPVHRLMQPYRTWMLIHIGAAHRKWVLGRRSPLFFRRFECAKAAVKQQIIGDL